MDKNLLSIQIYKINTDEINLNDLKSAIKSEYKVIDDLNDKYLLEIKYTESDLIEALEHEEVHPLDQYELTESIVEFGKELGININVSKDPTGIDPEAVKKFKEIALSKIREAKEKINKLKNKEGPENGNKN
jgi:hypothetical protein